MQISFLDKKVYLENRCPGSHITIDDSDDRAKKILEGYDFQIVEGRLVILDTQNGMKYKVLKDKLKLGQATDKEIQQILSKLL